MCGSNAGNTTAQIYSMMFSKGVYLLNEDMTEAAFNTKEGMEAFSFWADLFLKDGAVAKSVLENDNTTNRNLFAEGKLGMFMSGSYDIEPILEANPEMNMGFALCPAFAGGKNSAVLGGWNLGMSDTCKNPDLIHYYCSTSFTPFSASVRAVSVSLLPDRTACASL